MSNLIKFCIELSMNCFWAVYWLKFDEFSVLSDETDMLVEGDATESCALTTLMKAATDWSFAVLFNVIWWRIHQFASIFILIILIASLFCCAFQSVMSDLSLLKVTVLSLFVKSIKAAKPIVKQALENFTRKSLQNSWLLKRFYYEVLTEQLTSWKILLWSPYKTMDV